MRSWMIAAALVAASAPAAAQVRGIPVYNGGISSGLGLYGDLGFTNTAGGKGFAYAGTGRLGFGALGLTISVGSFNLDGPVPSRATYGATGNLRVFGGPLIPLSVTLQAGYGHIAGYTAPGGSVTAFGEDHFPIGLGLGVKIPNPVLTIRPWIAPRVDIVRAKAGAFGSSASSTDANFAVSGGLDFNTISGIGLQVSYDRVWAGNGVNPGIFGIGAHYAIKVPGL